MNNQKDRRIYEFSDKGKGFSKTVPNWLDQFNEEGDFLCGKISDALPELREEE